MTLDLGYTRFYAVRACSASACGNICRELQENIKVLKVSIFRGISYEIVMNSVIFFQRHYAGTLSVHLSMNGCFFVFNSFKIFFEVENDAFRDIYLSIHCLTVLWVSANFVYITQLFCDILCVPI